MPSIEKAVLKIILGEYSVLNMYENFGGGDFSPGKIEFGVVVVRIFLVVRVSIPGVNSAYPHGDMYKSDRMTVGQKRSREKINVSFLIKRFQEKEV